MIKNKVSLCFIFCALVLPWSFGSPLDKDANFDLSGQDIDQDAKLLAKLLDAMKRSRALPHEGQQTYSALGEIVDKDSLSKGEHLNRDLVLAKPNRRRKCYFFCWG